CVKTADVVGLCGLACVINEVDAACMVGDVRPVARVFPVTIDGQGFFVQDVQDTAGNQFLGKVIGPIVVGTVGNHHRQPIGVLIGAYEVIGRGLRCGIG